MIKAEVFLKLGRLNNEIKNLLDKETVIAIIAILFFVAISDVKKKHLEDSKDDKKTHI